MSQLPFRQQLEKHNQPEDVRQRLAAGQYHDPNKGIAQEYLASVDRKEAALVAARSEAREEENLSISRKALRNSERATRIAISAIMLSISMAILAIIQWYSK
ncbi:MAG: hypothetical protein Q8L02_04590 [Candidatus Nitrotoga sp.]|nr:hypothetical protein [Candidatus Nitrotoga sp.]